MRRLLSRRLVTLILLLGRGFRALLRIFRTQAFVFDQTLAHIEETNVFILEGRARGIVAEADVRAQIDGIDYAQRPRYVAAIELGDIDFIRGNVIAEIAEAVA